jgi:outer membrane protein TolC
MMAGCATRPPNSVPLDPTARADSFERRSLQEPQLRAFLLKNLGRVPEDAWDFEALSWAAFYFHPSLAAARAQWAAVDATQLTAKQRPNPTVVFTPGYNSTRVPGLDPWFPAINLDFLLQTTDKRARQLTIAKAETDSARLSVVTAAWQVRSDLRRALAEAEIASRRADLLRIQADTQHQLLHLFQQRLTAGSIAATELAATRTISLRADAAAADGAMQAALARARLGTAIGLPAAALQNVKFAPLVLPPEMLPAQIAFARREALRSRSDILAALEKYISSDTALNLEYAKRASDIHIGPGYLWDQNANKWTLALSFELPIFNHNEGPIGEAIARRAVAAAQFDQIQSQAISAIDLAVASTHAARDQLLRAQQLRASVADQETQTRRRAQLGSADSVEVETSDIDVSLADIGVLEAENALLLASGQLEDALQMPFSHLETLTAEVPTA